MLQGLQSQRDVCADSMRQFLHFPIVCFLLLGCIACLNPVQHKVGCSNLGTSLNNCYLLDFLRFFAALDLRDTFLVTLALLAAAGRGRAAGAGRTVRVPVHLRNCCAAMSRPPMPKAMAAATATDPKAKTKAQMMISLANSISRKAMAAAKTINESLAATESKVAFSVPEDCTARAARFARKRPKPKMINPRMTRPVKTRNCATRSDRTAKWSSPNASMVAKSIMTTRAICPAIADGVHFPLSHLLAQTQFDKEKVKTDSGQHIGNQAGHDPSHNERNRYQQERLQREQEAPPV